MECIEPPQDRAPIRAGLGVHERDQTGGFVCVGEAPDLFILSPGDFLRYYNGGALGDLTPYISSEARADFPASVVASRMVDGRIFAVPMEVEPMAILYSIEAFEEAGLDESDIPKTWDELLEIAGKLTHSKRFGVLFETTPGYYQNFTRYPFMLKFPILYIQPCGGRVHKRHGHKACSHLLPQSMA